MTTEQALVAQCSPARKYRYRLTRRVGLADDAVTLPPRSATAASMGHLFRAIIEEIVAGDDREPGRIEPQTTQRRPVD